MSGNTKTPPGKGGVFVSVLGFRGGQVPIGGVDRYFVNGIIYPIFVRVGVLLGGVILRTLTRKGFCSTLCNWDMPSQAIYAIFAQHHYNQATHAARCFPFGVFVRFAALWAFPDDVL